MAGWKIKCFKYNIPKWCNIWKKLGVNTRNNKKVLLHERKRHTARRVGSTCCAGLVGGGGGTPCWGGYPHQLDGVPPTWEGVPPVSWTGYLPVSWMGYPPPPQSAGQDTPPQVWTDTQTENITFPILRMRAVTNITHVTIIIHLRTFSLGQSVTFCTAFT